MKLNHVLIAAAATLIGASASAQVGDAVKQGGRIVAQPAHDVGAAKTTIPPVLESTYEAPYGLKGLKTCAQLANAIKDLNGQLGADFAVGSEKKENRAGKLAAAGGKTVINALVPFRGLVREISGAAPAQRRLNAAIDAGFARRGFLRGMAHARRCRIAS